MNTILIVEDSQLCRELLAAALTGNGFETVMAGDGEEAIEILQKTKVDLIFLDLAMPRMEGFGFLKVLRSHDFGKKMPVIVLTSTFDKKCVVTASQYGVQDYLIKTHFTIDDTLHRVYKLLGRPATASSRNAQKTASKARPAGAPAASGAAHAGPARTQGSVGHGTGAGGGASRAGTAASASHGAAATSTQIPQLLTRNDTLAAIKQFVGEAKSSAVSLAHIMEVSDTGISDVAKVAEAVKQDAVVAARLMQMANSPMFATAKRAASIEDAVRNLGMSMVRDVTQSMAVIQAFPTGGADGAALLRCWQHCFATAAILPRIAPRSEGMSAGTLHMIGLCHDVGEILLRQRFPVQFGAAADFARQTSKSLRETVPSVFGITLHEVSAAILQEVGLPETVTTPIRQYLEPPLSPESEPPGGLCRALRVADHLANAMLFATSADAWISAVSHDQASVGRIVTGPLDVDEVQAQIAQDLKPMAARVGDGSLPPLFPLRRVKLWYVRSSHFVQPDPIETALRMLAEVEVQESLPEAPGALSEYQGVVMTEWPGNGGQFDPSSTDQGRRTVSGKPLPTFCILPEGTLWPEKMPAEMHAQAGLLRLDRLAAFVQSVEKEHRAAA